jgi:hypothetical protein
MIMNIAVMRRRRRINNCCNSRAGSVKYYSLQPLQDVTLNTNDENSVINPGTFEQADERFFYIKRRGSNYAFKAIHNGSEYINSIKISLFSVSNNVAETIFHVHRTTLWNADLSWKVPFVYNVFLSFTSTYLMLIKKIAQL